MKTAIGTIGSMLMGSRLTLKRIYQDATQEAISGRLK